MSGKESEPLLGARARFQHLPLCVRRYCRMDKCLSSKAALLTLLWTVVILTGAQFLLNTVNIYTIPRKYWLLNALGNAMFQFLYVPAGFLADVVIGRHQAIIWSVHILLALITVGSFTLTIIQPVVLFKLGKNLSYLAPAWSAPVTIFRIMFIANIVQFGVDQVHDSPTNHQGLFIHWYFCAYMFGQFLAATAYSFHFLQNQGRSTNFTITEVSVLIFFSTLFLLILLASVFAARYRKRWFLSNPLKMNPYKLVFKITKFAYQHKSPVNRSAFTYCEDEVPSGLDLGKTRYGGPFTTEQVEDVKSFYGILKLLLISGTPNYLNGAMNYRNLNVDANSHDNTNTMEHLPLTYLLSPILILLYIFIINPVMGLYIPGMLKRMGAGIVVSLFALVYAFASSVITQTWNSKSLNCNLSSIEGVGNSSVALAFFEGTSYIVILSVLSSLSSLFSTIAQYEFICSQSPHLMKGFLIGITVSLSGIYELLASIVSFVISLIHGSFADCNWIFPLSSIVFGFVSLLGYVCVGKNYQYRKRDDICQVYQYVDDYYSKIVQARRLND